MLFAGPKASNTLIINDMDFTSTIMTQDEYTVSKMPSSSVDTGFDAESVGMGENLTKNVLDNQFAIFDKSFTPAKRNSGESEGKNSQISTIDDRKIQEISQSFKEDFQLGSADERAVDEVTEKLSGVSLRPSLRTSQEKKLSRSVTWADEKSDGTGKGKLCEIRAIEDIKGSTSKGKKSGRLGKRANKKGDGSSMSMDVCEFGEVGDIKESSEALHVKDVGDSNDMLRFTSAEACATALNAVSEAIASEEVEINDASM